MPLDNARQAAPFPSDLAPSHSRARALLTASSPQQWKSLFPGAQPRTVVTIGNFDGVHIGHQKILRAVVERAGAHSQSNSSQPKVIPAVLTFYPHPARVLRPEQAPTLLETLPQRFADFAALGIDATFVLNFDAALAKASAEEFARDYLVDTLRAQTILVGATFRFGHRQAGDVKRLQELGQQWGFEVEIITPALDHGAVVSSTAIREALRDGRIDDATRMLGHPFALAGEIRTGTGQGRKLVVPTLNLATQQETLPKNGVYATETLLTSGTYHSVTNIGVRPTFDGKHLAIESHLFDFAETLTQGPMKIRFLSRLRDEQKFPNPEALRAQILKDIARAKEIFATP